jgi:hypothetical protein
MNRDIGLETRVELFFGAVCHKIKHTLQTPNRIAIWSTARGLAAAGCCCWLLAAAAVGCCCCWLLAAAVWLFMALLALDINPGKFDKNPQELSRQLADRSILTYAYRCTNVVHTQTQRSQTMARIEFFKQCWYSSEKDIAQSALAGRTHYVDESTIKHFHSRIIGTKFACELLGSNGRYHFFCIVESLPLTPPDRPHKRGFRPVVFDISGKTVFRPDLEEMEQNHSKYNSSRKAWKMLNEWICTVSHKEACYMSDDALMRMDNNHKYQQERAREQLVEASQKWIAADRQKMEGAK